MTMTDQVKPNEDNQDVFKQEEPKDVFSEISDAVGKNYNDKEAVVKALTEKDSFIEQLQNENKEFGAKLDLLLQKQEESVNAKTVLEELTKNKPEEKSDELPTQPVDKEDIKSLFQELMTSTQQEQTAKQNLNQVNEVVRSVFGDNAASKLADRAASIGVSVEEIKTLASKSPQAALKLLGVDNTKVDTPVPPTGGSSDIPPSDRKTSYQAFKEEMAKTKIKPGTPKYYREMMKRQDLFTNE